MANWYAQLAHSQDFNAFQQWNSSADGTGNWLDTAADDYSNDTFYSNGKTVVIDTNLTCAKLMQDSNFFRFSGNDIVINADIEVYTLWNSIDIQPNSNVTIYGNLTANGTESGAICMYQDNTSLTIFGDITCIGDYSTGVVLSSGSANINIFNGTLLAGGEYANCVLCVMYGATVTVNNCTVIGGHIVDSSAIRLGDGECSIENCTLIAGEGVFCEAVNSEAFPVIVNSSNMISSEFSMPVARSLVYAPEPQNYYEIWDATAPTTLVLMPDAANLRRGVICGKVTGTLVPASPFRRLNRFV